MDLDSEAQILEAIRRTLGGEPDAFEVIVREFRDRIFRICSAHVRTKEDAADAVQEVFLRVYRSLGTYKLDRRFDAWIYSIAFNHLKTRHARTLRREDLIGRLRREYHPDDNDPEKEVLANLARKEVADAVRGLPVKLKQPVLLFYFEEMSVDDAADILGIGRENMKSRLFRARKILRRSLDSGGRAATEGRNEGI